LTPRKRWGYKNLMTFQRKLFLGFCIMIVPIALIGAEALWTNREEHQALRALGESMARSHAFEELETLLFRQGRRVFPFLTGMDPGAKADFLRLEEEIKKRLLEWEAAPEGVRRVAWRGADALSGLTRPQGALVLLALSVSVLYGGLVSRYTARLAGYLSTGGALTMGREVWDMLSDCGSEEWRCNSLATAPDSWQYT